MGNFSPFDGWLTFDGLRYTSFLDVTSNAWKPLSVEVQDDYGDYNVILQSTWVRPATRFSNGAHDFDVGVENFSVQTTFNMRSEIVSFLRTFLVFLCAARHPADFDGRPTAGAQVLARVASLPWQPCHFGPALHCRVPSRSERCLFTLQKR